MQGWAPHPYLELYVVNLLFGQLLLRPEAKVDQLVAI